MKEMRMEKKIRNGFRRQKNDNHREKKE